MSNAPTTTITTTHTTITTITTNTTTTEFISDNYFNNNFYSITIPKPTVTSITTENTTSTAATKIPAISKDQTWTFWNISRVNFMGHTMLIRGISNRGLSLKILETDVQKFGAM